MLLPHTSPLHVLLSIVSRELMFLRVSLRVFGLLEAACVSSSSTAWVHCELRPPSVSTARKCSTCITRGRAAAEVGACAVPVTSLTPKQVPSDGFVVHHSVLALAALPCSACSKP